MMVPRRVVRGCNGNGNHFARTDFLGDGHEILIDGFIRARGSLGYTAPSFCGVADHKKFYALARIELYLSIRWSR